MNQNQPQNPDGAKAGPALLYVVDDEPMLLELAAMILEPVGYRVLTFRDPGTALSAFSSAAPRPDLVITDYAMRPMSGLDLMQACRKLEPRQKVLFISGTVDEPFFDDPATKPDLFLAKPYQARELVDAVRDLLAR